MVLITIKVNPQKKEGIHQFYLDVELLILSAENFTSFAKKYSNLSSLS